jgi:hypothetical protein
MLKHVRTKTFALDGFRESINYSLSLGQPLTKDNKRDAWTLDIRIPWILTE